MSARRNHAVAVATHGQQDKTCTFRNSKTQQPRETFAGRTIENRRLPTSPIHWQNHFPDPAFDGAGTAIRTKEY
ncbi:MAG: hypothetical protein CR217_09410 [Beijerinckiaceae bacterium]|nr:MAG: hypothetical protein CR217_09410 [Beijerinckiaceae bacterium]